MALQEIIKANPVKTFVGCFTGIVGTTSGIYTFVEPLRNFVSGAAIFKQTGGIPLETGEYSLSSYFVAFLVSLIFVVCAGVVVYLLYRRGMLNSTSTGAIAASDNTETKLMREAYDDICDRIDLVVNNLYDAATRKRPRFNFVNASVEFNVDEKGNTKSTQDYEIETGDAPAHFWKYRIVVDGPAKNFRVLKDIGFEVASLTPNTSAVAVQTDNRGSERVISIFFLPEIPPRSKRSFRIEFDFPGWFGELFGEDTKSTNFPWSYNSMSEDDTANVDIAFQFAQQCGQIECQDVDQHLGNRDLSRTMAGRSTIWRYKNKKAPVGKIVWNFRFTRK